MRMGELWRRLGFLARRKQFDAEMDEALRFPAAMKADCLASLVLGMGANTVVFSVVNIS